MKVSMKIDHSYAQNGINVRKFKKGQRIESEPPEVVEHFINRGVAEKIAEPKPKPVKKVTKKAPFKKKNFTKENIVPENKSIETKEE